MHELDKPQALEFNDAPRSNPFPSHSIWIGGFPLQNNDFQTPLGEHRGHEARTRIRQLALKFRFDRIAERSRNVAHFLLERRLLV